MEDFINISIVDTAKQKRSVDLTWDDSHIQMFVSVAMYELELRCAGLDSYESIQRQLEIDVPRCSFFVNGEPIVSHEQLRYLPLKMTRFCTQASMAFPIEILTFSIGAIVAEPLHKSPLLIEIWEHVLFMQKQLRLIIDGETKAILCCIVIDIKEPELLIEIA
jgi:hypothetical protein